MREVVERAAGLDVHRDTVVTCVRAAGPKGAASETTRTFRTTTADLYALRDWLAAERVTHVAMESTGVFWKPVYYALEEGFELLLVNAAHVKNVPGRKTDVQDAQWLAELLAHGLLRGSVVHPPEIRELRDLTRLRTSLTQDRARAVLRLHKVLQDAGIKLSSVASDVMGASGRAMIDALVAGETNPDALAELARGSLRRKLPELRAALEGHFRGHHAFMARHLLALIELIERSLEQITARIEELFRPFAEELQRVMTIPGVGRNTAEVILSEIGVDLSRFPTSHHLASWAGMCPGSYESAGKHKGGRTRKGDRWLRPALVEAAHAAARARGTYLQALFQRVTRRAGKKKAAVAVGHAILEIAYVLVTRKTDFHDLGGDYFERRSRDREKERCLRKLRRLGFEVQLTEAAAA